MISRWIYCQFFLGIFLTFIYSLYIVFYQPISQYYELEPYINRISSHNATEFIVSSLLRLFVLTSSSPDDTACESNCIYQHVSEKSININTLYGQGLYIFGWSNHIVSLDFIIFDEIIFESNQSNHILNKTNYNRILYHQKKNKINKPIECL